MAQCAHRRTGDSIPESGCIVAVLLGSTKTLASLAAVIAPLQVVVVLLRLVDLALRGVLGSLFNGDLRSNLVLLERVLFLAPAAMLMSASRRNLGHLVRSAMVMMFAGALWSYFPSVPELLVTVGLVAAEVLAYVVIVRNFPILSGGHPAAPERQAAS